MIKRVNFTGRRRIPRNSVQIEVFDGQPRRFDAAVRFPDDWFPNNAAVYLEAMCAGSNVIQRFGFGEVGSLRPPTDRRLDELHGRNVFFALKVVDRTERYGRLLGLAENIRPLKAGTQTETGRRGILPIEPALLGQELWQLDFSGPHVTLKVNEDIPELLEKANSDPTFYAIAYPEIMRRVLNEAIRENVEEEEESDHWPVLWLRFGRSLHPTGEAPPPRDVIGDAREEWIDDVVTAFCEKHKLKERYAAALNISNGDEL